MLGNRLVAELEEVVERGDMVTLALEHVDDLFELLRDDIALDHVRYSVHKLVLIREVDIQSAETSVLRDMKKQGKRFSTYPL